MCYGHGRSVRYNEAKGRGVSTVTWRHYLIGLLLIALIWDWGRPWMLRHWLNPTMAPHTATAGALMIYGVCLVAVAGIAWGVRALAERRQASQ